MSDLIDEGAARRAAQQVVTAIKLAEQLDAAAQKKVVSVLVRFSPLVREWSLAGWSVAAGLPLAALMVILGAANVTANGDDTFSWSMFGTGIVVMVMLVAWLGRVSEQAISLIIGIQQALSGASLDDDGSSPGQH